MRFDPIRAGPYHCDMFDLLITNGTVVDGTGADRRIADIAITDGRIVAVGTDLGEAHEIIDAQGLLVTPGFVDVHSHYDGQATWDELLEPSSLHGVTTLVMGNCGVGFAGEARHRGVAHPADGGSGGHSRNRPLRRHRFHVGVVPEYLDALDERRWSVDVGAQVAHGAVRAYVMGERGAKNEAADPDDIEQMATIVRQAIEAGALVCRPRARSPTRRWTANRCRAPSPPRTNCSRWVVPCATAVEVSSNSPGRYRRARPRGTDEGGRMDEPSFG